MSTETITPDESLATSAEHPVLSVRGVVKRFGSNIVLRRLDLDVHRHEVVVLLGASGSGKSTLLRCANLLERVDDGQIFLSGTDITDPASTQIRFVRRSGSYSSTTTCSRTCQ